MTTKEQRKYMLAVVAQRTQLLRSAMLKLRGDPDDNDPFDTMVADLFGPLCEIEDMLVELKGVVV